MQIQLSAKNFELAETLKTQMEKKLKRLERLKDWIHYIKVTLHKSPHVSEVEFEVKPHKGDTMIVREEAKTLQKAFDSALKIVKRRIKEYKKQKVDKKS